jgi:hypothetical protein
MAQVVQPEVGQARRPAGTDESLGDQVRPPWTHGVGLVAEHEPLPHLRSVSDAGASSRRAEMLGQYRDCVCVQGDPVAPPGLGRRQPWAVGSLD